MSTFSPQRGRRGRAASLALLALLIAPSAFAQADLSIHFAAFPERAGAGSAATYLLTYQNKGPETARDAVIELNMPGEILGVGASGFTCKPGKPMYCTRDSLVASSFAPSILVSVQLPNTPGRVWASAAFGSETFDPTYVNNFTHAPTDIVAEPNVFAEVHTFQARVDPFTRARFSISAANWANTPAENARITATLPDGGTILSYGATHGPADCTISGNAITCDLGTLTKDRGRRIDIEYATREDLAGGPLRLLVEASASNGELDARDNRKEVLVQQYRWLVVENTNDDGGGSLRQALLDAHGCNYLCKVAFRIPAPVPASGWFTIQPRSPLPPVNGMIFVDGRTQTALTGDTNPEGPEIEINGALAGPAHGITIAGGCENEVNDIAVNGFDGSGVEIASSTRCTTFQPLSSSTIRASYIGTDPRGRTAVPNRRGVVIGGTAIATVTNNIISGNERAGVFVGGGSYPVVSSNRIGVGRNGEALGNGGSGVYVGAVDGDVDRNTIAHNGEWGIARMAGNLEIGISRNSLFDNHNLGIDIGLDFETPPIANDHAFPNPPELLSATYDASTNKTTIRGRIVGTGTPGTSRRIELFASAGPNRSGRVEGERFVGEVPNTWETAKKDFAVELEGDLTGQFITATQTLLRVTGFATPLSHRFAVPGRTSEFSAPIEVTR